MTAEEIGVSSRAAEVRPAGTRRTLAMSSRFAVELEPRAMDRRAITAPRSGAAGTRVVGERTSSTISSTGPRPTRLAMVMSVASRPYVRPQRRASTMYSPNITAPAKAIATPVSESTSGATPARRAVPRMASANAPSAAGRIRSPSSGTASRAAATAYSGVTNPVTVGPLKATAMLMAAMNSRPPSPDRTTRRTRRGPSSPRNAGRGSQPMAPSPTMTGKARVHARAAIPNGVNDPRAMAVAG